jgi:cell division protein FtsN
MTKYFVAIGNKIAFKGLTKAEAKQKAIMMLALSPRLDIFYYSDTKRNRKRIGEVV